MDPNSNITNSNTSGAANNDPAAASKRQAMTGQWRTPPLPVFASTNAQQPQPMPPQPAVAAAQPNIQLPESTDDYAKALQEAYRRGAEAAAALQQQQQQMPNAVSCPNFHQLPAGTTPVPTATSSTSTVPIAAAVEQPVMAPPPPQPAVMMVPNPLASNPTAAADARSFSLPDMASYAARAQAEEEKRKKRLARNRASARLRRLRKKNLVRHFVVS